MKKSVYSEHHIVCRSRDSASEETVFIPRYFHQAWHVVFDNLCEQETVTFIKRVNELFEMKGKVTPGDLKKLRQEIKKKGDCHEKD